MLLLQRPFHILRLLLALSISPLLALLALPRLTCYALSACFSTSSLDHALFLLISISTRPSIIVLTQQESNVHSWNETSLLPGTKAPWSQMPAHSRVTLEGSVRRRIS